MKHTILATLTVGAILLGLSLPVQAQSSLTSTTISTAATASQNTVVVASATGITARTTGIWLPATGEFLGVSAVSGTTITVSRGASGSHAHAIAASATAVVVPNAATTGDRLFGPCTGADARAYFQMLNVEENVLYVCLQTGLWQGRQGTPIQYNHTLVLTR